MTVDTSYKKNFLTAVIARVDFPSPIEGLDKKLPSRISSGIMQIFPSAEPTKGISAQLQVSPEQLKQKVSEHMQWRFYGKERDKSLTILPSAVFLEYTSYDSYETLKSDFLSALGVFFREYPDAVGNRLGLRYINEISFGDGDPFAWSDFLNKHMLCVFRFYKKRSFIARAFHNFELNFGEFNVRYQYGMYNPDYPARIKKKLFVLDLDAYSQSPQDLNRISADLDEFHKRIQELFELSITDAFRSNLNG